ncbi:formylmethanofuran dehydrogenase subunit C [Jiella sp. MQZ9-1]|uniref:Formylmethanofuran dehydrogenase subunit C n=1 Tax=Jiella flava TaxID=2816857 RepID=A0A939JSW4_9HYPH|nr:formylmethanofuran dehydrogenase subunit C [Jiella flava]MBO0663378.1 formylmethanofuran dehydrogenase subunit C [Jiella flava]MCD2471954.1 formylmethanofuran dehydrogenase subunit C [Jiella flava]
MSGLTFRKKAEPEERLDLSPLVPARLAGLAAKDIAALPIGLTRRGLVVDDVFTIAGDDPAAIRFEGGSHRFDRIGEAMAAGDITVDGDVGVRLGRAMAGGTITVNGTAGDDAGSAMAGGVIAISGDAGDRLGGPFAGEMTGMKGGTITVGGHAGARAGDRMRRGVIAIAGDAAGDLGSRMIAGTIVVGGTTAATPGRLMKRGTLFLCGGVDHLAPTFLDNGPADLLILKVMADAFAEGAVGPVPFAGKMMRRLGGDTAVLGLGEIFLPI